MPFLILCFIFFSSISHFFSYTTYQLKVLLDKRKDHLLAKIRTLAQPNEDDHNAHDILLGFLQFLLSMARTTYNVKIERSFVCSELDLVKILQFKRSAIDADSINDQIHHPLVQLEQNLLKLQSNPDLLDDVKTQLEEISFNLKKLLQILDVGLDSTATNANKEMLQDSPVGEPAFPQGEGIVLQYSMRPIFTVLSNEVKSSVFSEQLTTSYWCARSLQHRFIDEMIDSQPLAHDSVSCDLIEMIKTCLPPDTNLSNDCKRLLHLSASPQSNRERTTSAPCFRTRRVEVEPSTGRPEKKMYISRGRGFGGRSVQSRGDLFRSRPANTSRPPSLHVDDFLALETCGAQPTGPTGYNNFKLAREIISIRGSSRGRGRGRLLSSSGSGSPYRHTS